MTTLLSNDILTILSSYITPYNVKSKLKIYVNKRGKYIIKGYGFNETKKSILEIMEQRNDNMRNHFYSWEKKLHWFNVDDIAYQLLTKYALPVLQSNLQEAIRRNLLAMEGLYVKRAEYGCSFWNDRRNRHYWFLIDKGQLCNDNYRNWV